MKLATLALAATLALTGPAHADPLKIGVVPGVYGDAVEVAAAEAKALDVEVVKFSDWTMPNEAPAASDIDLISSSAVRFWKTPRNSAAMISPSWATHPGEPGALHKSLDEIPDGGIVQRSGEPGQGAFAAGKGEARHAARGHRLSGHAGRHTENPKNLTFTEIEGPQLVRVTGDVDVAQGYPHFIMASGAFDPTLGLICSGIEDKQFAVAFVSRADHRDDPRIRRFVDLFHALQSVKTRVRQSFAHSDSLYILAWQG